MKRIKKISRAHIVALTTILLWVIIVLPSGAVVLYHYYNYLITGAAMQVDIIGTSASIFGSGTLILIMLGLFIYVSIEDL